MTDGNAAHPPMLKPVLIAEKICRPSLLHQPMLGISRHRVRLDRKLETGLDEAP